MSNLFLWSTTVQYRSLRWPIRVPGTETDMHIRRGKYMTVNGVCVVWVKQRWLNEITKYFQDIPFVTTSSYVPHIAACIVSYVISHVIPVFLFRNLCLTLSSREAVKKASCWFVFFLSLRTLAAILESFLIFLLALPFPFPLRTLFEPLGLVIRFRWFRFEPIDNFKIFSHYSQRQF